jgi:hypothetical protein
MQHEPFLGPKLKVARGRRHTAELDAKVSAYFKNDPWAVLLQLDIHSGQHRIALVGREGVPSEFSVIFGDAVHNFRTALDILANDLVALGGVQPKKVYFPFGKDSAGFEGEMKSKMGQARPDIQAIIRSLKPYTGGDEVLRAMHDLDIGDKHIAIVGIGSGGNTGVVPLIQTNAESLPQGGGRLTFVAAFHAMKTVSIDLTGFPSGPAHIVTIGKIVASEIDCVIVKGLPLEGRSVVKSLNDMGDLVESIVQTFETHCFGSHKL